MDHNDYREMLTRLDEENATNLIALGTWVRNVALPWLWTEMAGAVLTPKPKHPNAPAAPAPSRLTPMSASDAVRKGLMVSLADRTKMPTDPAYYRAQLTMLDSEATRYCDAIDRFAQASVVFAENATVHTLHCALKDMMRYAVILLEDAAHHVVDVPGYFAAWRTKVETPFEVFKGTEQIVYGTYSGMTHGDRVPYIPVAVLRTAIELRLRHAFGISSYVNPTIPGERIPIDLSKLFEAIQTQLSGIQFLIDVHDVWKIYRWSNFYLHAGVRDFPWVPGFLLQYLRPLFAGESMIPGKAWSINEGIQMRRETWHAVRKALEPKGAPPSFRQRLCNAWRVLFPGERRPIELPSVEEKAAQCVFLD